MKKTLIVIVVIIIVLAAAFWYWKPEVPVDSIPTSVSDSLEAENDTTASINTELSAIGTGDFEQEFISVNQDISTL